MSIEEVNIFSKLKKMLVSFEGNQVSIGEVNINDVLTNHSTKIN